MRQGDRLRFDDLESLTVGTPITLLNLDRDERLSFHHGLSRRQIEILQAGGLIEWVKDTVT